jgi:hypothetical protein
MQPRQPFLKPVAGDNINDCIPNCKVAMGNSILVEKNQTLKSRWVSRVWGQRMGVPNLKNGVGVEDELLSSERNHSYERVSPPTNVSEASKQGLWRRTGEIR